MFNEITGCFAKENAVDAVHCTVNAISSPLWSWLVWILIGVGVFFTLTTGFVQLRLLGRSVKEIGGSRQNPNDPKLLATLGDLAYHRQLWGKAQGYLEASLRLEPTVHARLTLAKVFEQSQRHNDAQEQRRLALSAMDETAEH